MSIGWVYIEEPEYVQPPLYFIWYMWLNDNVGKGNWRWNNCQGRNFITFSNKVDAVAFKLKFEL